jgi:hypothetical protein
MPTASSSFALASGLALLAGCQPDYEIIPEPPDVDPGAVTECGFSPISGTRLSVYDCNPVFAGTDEEWGSEVASVGFHATDVLGHAFYQIWYSAAPAGGDYGDWGLGYAISGDGTNWDLNPANPLLESQSGSWDVDGMDAIQVVWDESRDQYMLAWQGFDISEGLWGLGVATSFDGVAWSRLPDPVIDFADPNADVSYCWPLGLTPVGDGTFKGYISGSPSVQANVCQIYPVVVNGPDDWEPSTHPALEAGPDPYDRAGMVSASVVKYGETWYMFYVGFLTWEIHEDYQTSKTHFLNLATSTDGQTWTKSPSNPLPVNLTAEHEITAVAAQVVGSRIMLWVTDYYADLGKQAVGYYYFEPDIGPHP